MNNFEDKVAVITGAASGIGFALAQRFARAGMKIVLADIEAAALEQATASIKAEGASAIAVLTNVMQEAEVKRLANIAFETWGNVHVLCNNAGVSGSGINRNGVWAVDNQEWDWVMGVNFRGVLNGVRHFVPRMLENGEAGHIVNTASMAGLLSGATSVPYTVSKHGVVALTETLYKDLKTRDARISASVLCPGWVDTKILDSDRNRPDELISRDQAALALTPEAENRLELVRNSLKEGFSPKAIADAVFDAIASDRFYILPIQPYMEEALLTRLQDIQLRRNPTIPLPSAK